MERGTVTVREHGTDDAELRILGYLRRKVCHKC